MSSTSLAELVASLSDSSERECELSPSARSTDSVELCSQSIGREFQSLKTCEALHQPLLSLLGASTSSAVAFPAKTSAKLERDEGLTASAVDCGASSGAYAKRSGPISRSSKTCLPCVPVALNEWSGIFPPSGMTQSGQLLARAPWVPHIHETGCSLWPTPRADGGNNAGGSNSRRAAIKRGTYISGSVNPSHREWLMGFPIGHTEIEFLETRSSRKSRKSSGARS